MEQRASVIFLHRLEHPESDINYLSQEIHRIQGICRKPKVM